MHWSRSGRWPMARDSRLPSPHRCAPTVSTSSRTPSVSSRSCTTCCAMQSKRRLFRVAVAQAIVNRIESLPVETPRQIELRVAESLEQIPGVLAAAVWLGEASQVREVYIAAAPHAAVPAIQQAAAEVLRREG